MGIPGSRDLSEAARYPRDCLITAGPSHRSCLLWILPVLGSETSSSVVPRIAACDAYCTRTTLRARGALPATSNAAAARHAAKSERRRAIFCQSYTTRVGDSSSCQQWQWQRWLLPLAISSCCWWCCWSWWPPLLAAVALRHGRRQHDLWLCRRPTSYQLLLGHYGPSIVLLIVSSPAAASLQRYS